jgi:periplasmic divalent cation tolerance protein
MRAGKHRETGGLAFWSYVLFRVTLRGMNDYIQVVTTTEHREDAERIARTLVEERLAACVQVSGPITSVYRWKGQIETAQEWQCRAKSRRDLYEAIEQAIRRIHPYEVPEIVAMPILAGSAEYLAWLDGEVKMSGE